MVQQPGQSPIPSKKVEVVEVISPSREQEQERLRHLRVRVTSVTLFAVEVTGDRFHPSDRPKRLRHRRKTRVTGHLPAQRLRVDLEIE